MNNMRLPLLWVSASEMVNITSIEGMGLVGAVETLLMLLLLKMFANRPQ